MRQPGNTIKYGLLLLLVYSLLLSGCRSGSAEKNESVSGSAGKTKSCEISSEAITVPSRPALINASPVPEERVSVRRQGCSNFWTLSETGIYVLAQEKTGYYILYCDYESDRFIKLCSRPDCAHNNKNCDAFLGKMMYSALGYYNGKLYYTVEGPINPESYHRGPMSIWYMDPDGRNKTLVTYLQTKEEAEKTPGFSDPCFVDAYFYVGTCHLDENGEMFDVQQYCSLDRPSLLQDAAPSKTFTSKGATGNGIIISNHGTEMLLWDFNYDSAATEAGERDSFQKLYSWNAADNSIHLVCECDRQGGYYTDEYRYGCDDGVIFRQKYHSGEREILGDTGCRGQMSFTALPDCIMLSDRGSKEADSAGIYFYDWDCRPLGEYRFRFEQNIFFLGFAVSETKNRILLDPDVSSTLPRYYIEKSDLGTGHITLHEYQYPEMDLIWK